MSDAHKPVTQHGTPKGSVDLEQTESMEAGTMEEIVLQRYPLLVNKSKEELAALNKKVVKKLDWKFLPCITMMLLMK
jgi:hypothetical protein